jgi:acyl-CoA thioesterase
VSAGPHAYDVDTAAVITDRWNVLGGRPNGGYVLGVALRALARVMPEPDPLVVSAFFLRPTLPGPAEVATEMARAGRRIATGAAQVIQDGRRRCG